MSQNTTTLNLTQMPLDLGDNLTLRFATVEDTAELVDFNLRLHETMDTGPAVRDLMSGQHPTCKANDFTVVEETQSGKIVSSACLISQTWSYSGIPFKFGRPEFVATDAAYRRRGLVRKQFEVIHALSESRGELMQGITGIPWYYRQFGYEMAMDIEGERVIDARHIPNIQTLRKSDVESCRLRAQATDDTNFIQNLYEGMMRRHVFACPRTSAMWNYEFTGRSEGSQSRFAWGIIEDAAGTPLGYVQYMPRLEDDNLIITQLELKSGVGYLHLTPSLLRALWLLQADEKGKDGKAKGLQLMLGREHPVYSCLPKGIVRQEEPYALFIRIPTLIAFLRHIQPALEKHLVGTVAEGYSGQLKLNFYRSGLHIKFNRGKISELSNWESDSVEAGDAAFPELTFLQLLCGRRRTEELTSQFVDCWAHDTAAVLLDCLFPPFTGEVWVFG